VRRAPQFPDHGHIRTVLCAPIDRFFMPYLPRKRGRVTVKNLSTLSADRFRNKLHFTPHP
jgi:hypothetical protein